MTKILYNGSRRDGRGRFSRSHKVGLVLLVLAAILLLAHPFIREGLDRMSNEVTAEAPAWVPAVTVVAHADTTMEAKVEALKEDIVARLKGCESAGADEADGLIVFDSNAKASIGLLQFQVDTVVHYVKTLRGESLTKKEAIVLALDEEKATQLATDIIFLEKGGVWNWKNCATKLELAPEIEVIKKLTQ